jgi:hypothetical protein
VKGALKPAASRRRIRQRAEARRCLDEIRARSLEMPMERVSAIGGRLMAELEQRDPELFESVNELMTEEGERSETVAEFKRRAPRRARHLRKIRRALGLD